jgi:hypothetical protein
MINDRNASAQPPRPPAETTTLESRKGGPRRLRRVVRRGGPLRPTTAELIRVQRHKFPDAHRRPAGRPLHPVRQPVIAPRPVQLGHCHQMPGQVVRQPRPFQLPFPILGGDVRVRDLTVQRVRVLPGDPVHVLRPRTGELVYPAQVRPRVGEDGSDYPSDIRRGTGEALPRPNGSSIRPRSRTLGPVENVQLFGGDRWHGKEWWPPCVLANRT